MTSPRKVGRYEGRAGPQARLGWNSKEIMWIFGESILKHTDLHPPFEACVGICFQRVLLAANQDVLAQGS